MITLLDATVDDIADIQLVAEKTWWPTYAPFLSKEQIRYMLTTIYAAESMRDAIEKKREHFVIIREGKRVSGFVSFGEHASGGWKIFKLYVMPEYHGRGFGKMLLEEVKARATKADVPHLVLNVNRHNPAGAFYQRFGFSIWKEEDIPIGPYWMNDYVMKLPLTPS